MLRSILSSTRLFGSLVDFSRYNIDTHTQRERERKGERAIELSGAEKSRHWADDRIEQAKRLAFFCTNKGEIGEQICTRIKNTYIGYPFQQSGPINAVFFFLKISKSIKSNKCQFKQIKSIKRISMVYLVQFFFV